MPARVEPNEDDTDPYESSDSDGDDDDSFGTDESESDEESDDDDEDGKAKLGPLQRVSKKLRKKQQRIYEARRHPTIEWKESQRRQAKQEVLLAAEVRERQRQEEVQKEKQGRRERKLKRKAQRELTKQKEQETRELLRNYEVLLAKSDTRARLLTEFATDNRAKQKARLAKHQAEQSALEESIAIEKVQNSIRQDAAARIQELAELKESTDVADRIGRRVGILPAINTPPVPTSADQDETSSLVVLLVNKSDAISLGSPASTGTIDKTQSLLPPTKRLFFTVNLKRFKHAEAIRGQDIGDLGAKELARSLLTGACPRVKKLQLGWNGIKFPGTVALADCFTRGSCGQLQTLDLKFNLVDAQALRSLVEAIEKAALPELLDLFIQGNIIGDEGARQLAHAMLRGSLRGLRTIDIRQNSIRNDGIRALWNAFSSESLTRFCPKLQLLDMRRNEAQGSLTRSFCPCPPYIQF